MRVEIIKCFGDHWIKPYIGQVFEVEAEAEFDYKIKGDRCPKNYCKIVN